MPAPGSAGILPACPARKVDHKSRLAWAAARRLSGLPFCGEPYRNPAGPLSSFGSRGVQNYLIAGSKSKSARAVCRLVKWTVAPSWIGILFFGRVGSGSFRGRKEANKGEAGAGVWKNGRKRGGIGIGLVTIRRQVGELLGRGRRSAISRPQPTGVTGGRSP